MGNQKKNGRPYVRRSSKFGEIVLFTTLKRGNAGITKQCGSVVALLVALVANCLPASSANAQFRDVFSDSSGLLQTLGGALGCSLSTELKADMQVEPLYQQLPEGCSAAPLSQDGNYYTDPRCLQPVSFRRTSQQEFCALAVDGVALGDGALVEPGVWTLSPGSRYDIGALSIEGKVQPYRLSQVFRQVRTARGNCQLEMRIYKNAISAGGLRPLIALHGGSWSSRGFGAMGIEASAPHFTDREFVVFAPFYRLIDDSDGPVACNDASFSDVTDDVQAAFEWVQNEAENYGASGRPVLFGQSAGAHLALSLLVNNSDQVERSILLYPPTDFEDFLLQVQSGEYTNEEGLGILADALGGNSASTYDISRTPVPENSFPATVSARPSLYPPVYLMHGGADELVPARQSLRLCDALAGRDIGDYRGGDTDEQDRPLRDVISCGPNSELHLFAEAKHALDVCLSNDLLLESSCLSGSRNSKNLVADSMQQAASWAATPARSTIPNAGGGGVIDGFLFALLLLVFGFWPSRKNFRMANKPGWVSGTV